MCKTDEKIKASLRDDLRSQGWNENEIEYLLRYFWMGKASKEAELKNKETVRRLESKLKIISEKTSDAQLLVEKVL